MTIKTIVPDLFNFIEQSPTPFHATSIMREKLLAHDFNELSEGEIWSLEQGKKYFVSRNGSIIAFSLGLSTSLSSGFRIIAAHTDSPCLQLKPRSRENQSPYLIVGVEKYGGAILHTWFDRELSLAGRVSCVSSTGDSRCLLVDFKRPVAFIPSLAMHLDRSVNEGLSVNVQNDLSPILAQSLDGRPLVILSMLSEQIAFEYPALQEASIIGYDLFCYDPAKPAAIGFQNEFIAAPRLDNLLSCHIGLEALYRSGDHVNGMLIYTNHEEIGSTSNSGALGSFPDVIISRILGGTEEKAICLHHSFLLSLDNAHASHPNYPDKTDGDHQILLNHGPVIKINASQRYTSNAQSSSLFRILASETGVQTQDFVMRSDMTCGSTIGPISSAQLGIQAVDVGVPTLAMHSVREVTGAADPDLMYQVIIHYFNRQMLPHFKEIQHGE